MALFGNQEDKDQKQEEKMRKLLKKYRLESVSADISDDVQAIAYELMGNKAIEVGTLFQGNGIDATKMSYLSAIMKQNWIIIKLLDEIAHK